MEELLAQVITISSNFPQIERAAREAVDFLNVQHGLIRDPAYELREKCLFVIQLCLETRRTKFTTIAIAGLQKIIRDDRFHSSIEPENDSKWLPLQLLQATNCFVTLSDDTQVDILKIILNIACSKKWPMNGRTIISILCLCGEAFQSGNTSIRSAAQAAASQTLRSFCMVLEEDQSDCDSDGCNFNETIPVMQFICSKIDEPDRSNNSEKEVVFYLECLLTLCSSLPSYVSSNIHLKTFFWQKLCPMLISVLGTPKVDKNIVTRNSGVEKEHGRGSGGLSTAPSHNSSHAKTVYCINAEFVRLFGAISTLRPVLESLFHRVLLYPAPEHRLDALKAVAELFRNGNRIVDICGPLVQEDENSPLFDLSLLRLIMDSIEEGSNSTFLVMEASVMCCFALLKTIQKMCLGECIPPNISETVIKMYPKLVDSDYEGPQTYQSTARLPQQYRETIEKETKFFDEIHSDNEEEESCNSDDSGDTEGPQEEDVDVEDSKESTENNIESAGSATLDVGSCGSSVYFENTARQGARHFFCALRELLPLLVSMRSSIQVDQSLQSFASQYCDGLMLGEESSERGGVKAEGFYLAVYSALLLDLSLWQSNNYGSSGRHITITEDEFVIKVKGIGLLTYLSSVWFRELYQLMVSSSLLQTFGYLPPDENSQPHALINLLTDVEGVGSYQKGCQMLWECRRLVKSIACEDHVERDVGLRLSRRILTCCWDTLLKVLAVPLYEKKSKFRRGKLRDLKFLRSEQHSSQIKHLITTSIDGLQILTKLCGDLGLQERCGSIIELLVAASCDHSENTNNVIRFPTTNPDIVRLTPSHSLSLDLLLGSGLEIGSHCSDCWPHIFRCCVYVKKLEHKYFSRTENRNLGSTTVLKKNESTNSTKNASLTFDPQLEEDTCVDVYSFLCSSELTQTVSELMSTKTQGTANTLKQSEAAKVICILSQLVDKFFEDAAMKLNLKSLESFSSALCFCSQNQLFSFDSSSSANKSKRFWWHRGGKAMDSYADTLLLDFAGEILLKSIRSGRPLFHVIRIWENIVLHLMKAACHKDLTVSRKAIKHIHDSINAALIEHPELSHFCTTEMLFKPFENLLGLELCETDIQDQIISCICEFVEANFREIRSGWRPLFGALRATSTNLNTLLDVFRVFLEIENVSVFSYAAVDYILCLLKHLKVQSSVEGNSEFGFETLKYLNRCQSILSSMYTMPQGVKFNSAAHIQVSDGLLVDPIINNFEPLSSELTDDVPPDVPINADMADSSMYLSQFECKPSLDAIDRPSGVLRVWFLLLEGMHSAAISANSEFQPSLLNMLYEDLGKLIDVPGPIFGLIVFNRIVLPMAQSWLRQLAKIPDGDYSGLKQSTGLLSDLVLQYFDRLHCEENCHNLLNLLLSQVLLLLSECSVHPVPAVARIGPPCIRHIILNVGKNFKADQWKIVTTALYKLGDMSLKPLCQLMVPFSKDSEYYYGDTGQVKVAVRQSVSPHEVYYTNQLCHRVFLLDEQYERSSIFSTDFDDQKVYTFLVYKNKEDFIRIPIKALVTSLQAHQYILQVITDILLQGTEYKVYSLTNNSTYHSNDQFNDNKKEGKKTLPGLMSSLSSSAFARLLQCLDHSFNCALAFDSRPGLKFLVQKVATLQQAANLYRQANTSWTVKTVSLFEYSLHHIRSNRLTIENVKKLLDVTSSDFEPDAPFFLNALRKTFNDLCTTYLNIVIANGSEIVSTIHDKAEKPLFYLVASREEDLTTEDDKTCPDGNQNPLTNSETPHKKPFFLSDFSKDSTSDSESPEKDDEGRPNLSGDEIHAKERHQYERFENILSMMTDLTDYEVSEKDSGDDGHRTKVKDLKEPAVPPEIEQQRRHSFLKDSEALKRVWTQMLSSVFELLRQLDDEDFQKLLPIFIDGVRRLMAHLSDPALKKHLSDFFQRIAVVYGFGIV